MYVYAREVKKKYIKIYFVVEIISQMELHARLTGMLIFRGAMTRSVYETNRDIIRDASASHPFNIIYHVS